MNFDPLITNMNKHVRLNQDEIHLIKSKFTPYTLKRKEFLLQKGEICHKMSFVVQGCTRVYTIDTSGNEHITMFGIEDWWISDLTSFFSEKQARFYIDALTDTQLLQITKQEFDLLLKQVPTLELWIRTLFLNALIASEKRIDQHLSMTAEERFGEFQTKYPELDQRIPLKYIATYLGITPEFFSMLRKKWTNS